MIKLPKKNKKITTALEIGPKESEMAKKKVEGKGLLDSLSAVDPVLVRDEEKSAVSIGLVFGIAYLIVGALISASPSTAAMVLRALTYGLVEVNPAAADPSLLIVGLISAVMLGVIGGFFYAKIYNMIKKG